MEIDLLILQNYRPRCDSKNRYRWVRRDNGQQVTWPRSQYIIAFRDIVKVAKEQNPYRVQRVGKREVRRIPVPVDSDDLKYVKTKKPKPHRHISSDPDARMYAKYLEVCARLEARKVPSVEPKEPESAGGSEFPKTR